MCTCALFSIGSVDRSLFTSDGCYGLDEADVLECVSPIQPEELQRFRQDIGEQITDVAGRINAVYDGLYGQNQGRGAAQSSLDDCVRGIESLVMSFGDDDHDRYVRQTDPKAWAFPPRPSSSSSLLCLRHVFHLHLSLSLLLAWALNNPLRSLSSTWARKQQSIAEYSAALDQLARSQMRRVQDQKVGTSYRMFGLLVHSLLSFLSLSLFSARSCIGVDQRVGCAIQRAKLGSARENQVSEF